MQAKNASSMMFSNASNESPNQCGLSPRGRASARRPARGNWSRKSQRGGSVIEFSFMMPWIFFLFVGILDFGFFGYALVATQNAARAAAMMTSQDTVSQSQAIACSAVKQELAYMPNNASFMSGGCSASPLTVVQTTLSCGGVGTQAADCADDNTATSSRVSVAYQTIAMIPIPLLLNQQFTFTRTAEMRILVQ